MARKKNRTRNTIFIILGILVVIFFLNSAGFFSNPLSAGLNDQYVELEKGVTSTPYPCPSTANGGCLVNGLMNCDVLQVPTNVPVLKARVRDLSYGDDGMANVANSAHWIALDNPTTTYYDLESWTCSSHSLQSTLSGITRNYFNLPYDTQGFIGTYNGRLTLFIHKPGASISSTGYTTWFTYIQKAGADLTPTPKYGCTGKELCTNSAVSQYSCSGKLVDLSNNILAEKLYQSTTIAGKDLRTPQKSINAGTTVKMTGGDTNKVEYIAYKIIQTCTKDYCNPDKTGYFKCTNNIPASQVTYCDTTNGFICDDSSGSCTFSLNKEIKFTDSTGEAKNGFNPTETIFLNSKITTNSVSSIKSANVKFVVYPYGSSTPLATYEIPTYDFTNPSFVPTQITNPGNAYLGQQFYVVVSVTYNGKTFSFGKDNKEYSFRIAPSLTCNVVFMSNIDGQTRSTLFKGYPVDLKIFTSISGQASPVEKVNLDLTLNNGMTVVPITLTSTNLKSSGIASSDNSVWEYVYEFTPTQSGSLDSQISVEKSSVVQICNVQSATIGSLTVTPTFTNIAKYVYKCVKKDTPIDLTIEVKDNLGNYVDPQVMTLKVIFANTTLQNDITSSLQKTETGKYHFTYNFPQLGSTYFQLSSNLFNGINTGALDVLDSCSPPECVQNSDCPNGKVCQGNQCKDGTGPDWIKYVWIIAIGIVVLVIILIVVRIIKKPKQNVYI